MYKLVIADDEGSKSTVPVIRDEITIGRKDGNTIRLTERNVSRRHARVVRENGRVYVEDISARYGIKKNGAKIDARAEFSPGDIVSIGDYQLTLKAKRPEKATEPSPHIQKDKLEKDQPSSAENKQDDGTQVLPAMPAKLVVISSNFAGQEFPLNRKEMIVGRGEDCDIIIDHRSVSQKHAKVIRESGSKYQIVDLNSKNGISIGGEQYRAVHIKRGDVIELGHVKFRFVEPGENYVFTPQPSRDEVDFDASVSSSNKGAMIAAVLVVAMLVGAAFIFLSGDDDTVTNTTGEPTKAIADNDQGDSNPAVPLIDGPPDDDNSETNAADGDKVDQAIVEARTQIDQGELDQAIGALESAQKYLEPTPDQDDRIAELMGSARTERPFKQDYQSAKDNIKSKDFDDALGRLSEIPKHSVFHKLYRSEGLMDQAINGIVTQAEDALAKDNKDSARSLAEEALVYDSDHEGANSLLERLDEAKAKVVASQQTERSGARNSGNSGSSSGSSSKPPTKRAEPKLSAADAKDLYRSAQKKIFKSDPGGAVQDCKKALSAGHRGCYRILAIAHKQMGDNNAACSNFDRYLSTDPVNASAVQRQMEQLGCN
jgi:pSer/pThr/pTyr-binding forkhead associated (FHA) protein